MPQYFRPRGASACAFSFIIASPVLKFRTKARTRFTPLLHRTPPGRPGDLHPESPTDPDVNLSIHPARVTPRKPAGFRQDKEFLRLPVDSILTRVTCPLCSTGITPLPRSYEAVRP